jgi:polysaccharide chain length determinant protein (PEP-CTERM system associated)
MVGLIFSLIYNEARRILCYRWMLAAISSTIFIVAAAYILSIPNSYQAWGQIFVPEGTPLTTAAEKVSMVEKEYGGTGVVQKTMLNDENLRKVIQHANPAATMTSAQLNAATGALRKRIKVESGVDGFIDFRYSDSDPVTAQRVTKVIMTEFIGQTISRNRKDLGEAVTFLDAQLASYEKKLLESQTAIASFRRQYPKVAVDTGPVGDNSGELASARIALASAQATGSTAAGGTAAAPQAITTPQDAAIADQQARLAALLTQYTEQFPDVIATRRQIASLQAQRAQSLASQAAIQAAAPPASAPRRPANPALAVARERVAMAQARAQGSGAPDAAPNLAAQWAELRRKNDLLAANYQELLGRREGALMAQAVYGTASGKYQITREPTVPTGPAGPNRLLFLAAAAVFALGAGVSAAYTRGAIAGVFVSPHELEGAFELPVIGTVSWEPAWHTRKSNRKMRPLLGGAKKRALAAS